MTWIDTGVNLLDPRFTPDEVLNKAYEASVTHLVVISSTIAESQDSIALCTRYNSPQHTTQYNTITKTQLACTAGIHPHYANDANTQSWAKLKSSIADKHVSAIGECGLDFNRNFSTRSNQLYAFEQQLNLAAENNMGVYLHERDAFGEQMKLLEQYSASLKFMVAHCFTGNKEQLDGYLSLGCYIGITGWLCDTKRGKALQDAIHYLPLSRLLLETDSPYLFPKTLKPRRSKNEPCNLPHIASYFSELTGHNTEQVKQHSYNNALALFFSEQN